MMKELQFETVLDDKGIKSYFDVMDPALVKNRVMMSYAEKASSKSQKHNDKVKNNVISGGWQRIFMICVTSKSYVSTLNFKKIGNFKCVNLLISKG